MEKNKLFTQHNWSIVGKSIIAAKLVRILGKRCPQF